MYTFKVEAYDNKGLIGEGTHERAIIDCERFMKKCSGCWKTEQARRKPLRTITEPCLPSASEAYSLIVQCTLGCSHNKCAFCTMYRDKKFSINPIEQVLSDLDLRLRALYRERSF